MSLVRGKADQKVYAMKTLRKGDMLKQADVFFIHTNRDFYIFIDCFLYGRTTDPFCNECKMDYFIVRRVPR